MWLEQFAAVVNCAAINLFSSPVWNDGTCALSMIDKFVLISHEAGWLLLLLQNDK